MRIFHGLTHPPGFKKGDKFQNARFFTEASVKASSAMVETGFPEIVHAYQEIGTPVEVYGGPLAQEDDAAPANKLTKEQVIEQLTSQGIEYDPALRVSDLRKLLP